MARKTTSSIYICLAIISVLYSCTKEAETQQGSIILSSEFNFENATLLGYNFEDAITLVYPSTVQDNLPDIIVDQFRLLDGSIEPGFESPSNPNGFALSASFQSMEESQDYFINKLLVIDTTLTFSPTSDTVKPYQVWVLKTASNNYIKIHTDDIYEVKDSYGKHVEVKIDYYYQPDGTPNFPK